MKYKKLNNGATFIHHPTTSDIVHLAIYVKVGTKDEIQYTNGIAHFTEHMVFKGTNHHTAQEILQRIDEYGGEFNAYTTKTYTAYGIKTLKRFESEAIQLLMAMVFHSTFPEVELLKEQKVILEEVKMIEDDAEETLFEQFERAIFEDVPLCQPILGTKQSIQKIDRDELIHFYNQYYVPNNCVFSYSGAQPESLEASIELLQAHFDVTHAHLFSYKKVNLELQKPQLEQAHVVLSHEILSHHHPLYEAFQIINQIYGGSMNALLFQELRENHGYCYHTYSSIETYDEGGVLYTYFATDKENIDACIKCIDQIINRLSEHITQDLLYKTKQNMITNLYMNFDNDGQFVNHYGKSMLIYDKIYTLEHIENLINQVTINDINDALKYINLNYGQMKIIA